MPTWNSEQYLKFARERTQPSQDLAARVPATSPARVIDLGCGPGNSTAVVAARWPHAAITGLDSSGAMLAAAKKNLPTATWIEADLAHWAATSAERYDVVFSNAALQWLPEHATLLPQLMARVAPGGTLAFQIPANPDAAPHQLMRELAASPAWHSHFPRAPREWRVEPPEFYYDTLAPHAAQVEMWATEYFHVLDGLRGIVEWYRGTGLRPWLDALPDEPTRERFLADYEKRLGPFYPLRPDGKVLFPFRRLFVLAHK